MSLITEQTEIDPDNNNEFDISDNRDWMAIAAVMPNALPINVGLCLRCPGRSPMNARSLQCSSVARLA